MAWVMTAVAVVGAGASIVSSNQAAAAQRDAMSRQQADLGFSISFNEEATRLEQTKADIGFAQEFNNRLEAYNDIRSQQMSIAGYQGRTVDSMSKIMEADEKQWEYDSKIMEINNELNKKAIAIGNMQQTLGMSSTISGLEASKSASRTAQTWSNISTVANTAGTIYKYSGNSGGSGNTGKGGTN